MNPQSSAARNISTDLVSNMAQVLTIPMTAHTNTRNRKRLATLSE